MHPDLISRGLNTTFQLEIQIACREEERMELTPESIEEFHAARRLLLLGDAGLSSLKVEVDAEALSSKKSKGRKRKVAQGTDISTTPTKKMKGS